MTLLSEKRGLLQGEFSGGWGIQGVFDYEVGPGRDGELGDIHAFVDRGAPSEVSMVVFDDKGEIKDYLYQVKEAYLAPLDNKLFLRQVLHEGGYSFSDLLILDLGTKEETYLPSPEDDRLQGVGGINPETGIQRGMTPGLSIESADREYYGFNREKTLEESAENYLRDLGLSEKDFKAHAGRVRSAYSKKT